MGWFKPNAMKLEYGEPIHQMVARAFLHDAIRVKNDILTTARYHFVGPHGIVYRGTDDLWKRECRNVSRSVAQLCEEIQQDFNERIAAMGKAREFARDTLSVPPLFSSTVKVAKEPGE